MSRYASNLREDHWKAIVWVLRYLRYTLNYGLHYTRYLFVLEEYNDVNRISVTKDTKIHEWICLYAWRCNCILEIFKKTCIARSTMESEFIALDKAGEEVEWLLHFLEDMSM
jgi:hypothetical protein